MARVDPKSKGQLNYAISSICEQYLLAHGLSYDTINDVLGAQIGALLEFYRLVASPYEDKKIAENGNAYVNLLSQYSL